MRERDGGAVQEEEDGLLAFEHLLVTWGKMEKVLVWQGAGASDMEHLGFPLLLLVGVDFFIKRL
jgi:hypothetical protein